MVVDDVADVMAAFGGPPVVDDEERARYGMLLDRAAERGLLTPQEYGFRLGELASATTVDRMRQLVTELPVLVDPVVKPTRRLRKARPAAGTTAPTGIAGRRSSPWLTLVVVATVLVLALLGFSIYAEHVAHAHQAGLPPLPDAVVRAVSVLRS